MTAVQERAGGKGGCLDALSERAFFLVLWLPLLAVYLATASWTIVRTPDPLTNAITAWNLAENGSFILDDYAEVTPYAAQTTWIVDSPSGPVSIYPPGAALLGAPFAAIWPGEPETWSPSDSRRWSDEPVDVVVPPLAPGVLVAVLTTSLSFALAAMVAVDLVTRLAALGGAWLLGLGTGAWSVAADGLWQHGPAMFWVALGVYLASRDRFTWSGLAFGAAILTRPPTAVVAASIGSYLILRERQLAAFWRIAMGAIVGLGLLLAYNWNTFGGLSLSGGYPEWFVDGARDVDGGAFVSQATGGLFGLERGLLVYSPFLAIQAIGLARMRGLPAVVVGASLGGALYLAVQWQVNKFGSGSNFFSYRFPLEALAAASPGLIMSWCWIGRHKVARMSFLIAAAWGLMWGATIEFVVT